MFFGSALQKCLKEWIKTNHDLGEALFQLGDPAVRTEREAEFLCEALEQASHRLPSKAEAAADMVSTPFNCLCSLFQSVATPVAYEIAESRGVPLLSSIIEQHLYGEQYLPNDDLLFGLKILAAYHYLPAISHIAHAVRKRMAHDHYMWPVIFAHYGEPNHPHALQLVRELENPIPDGIVGSAYLKLTNEQYELGNLEVHTFSGLNGCDRLRRSITNTDPNFRHEAMLATLATTYLTPNVRDRLLLLASRHPDAGVRIEADRIAASYQNSEAVRRLADWSLDPRFSRSACHALESAGHADRIPKATRNEGFATLALLSNTLEESDRFGVIPDQLGIVDTRECYWPPMGEMITCWLCHFSCRTMVDSEQETGVAFVTDQVSIHPDPAVAALSSDDLYAFYCAWHAMGDDASREDIQSMADEGHRILAEAKPI